MPEAQRSRARYVGRVSEISRNVVISSPRRATSGAWKLEALSPVAPHRFWNNIYMISPKLRISFIAAHASLAGLLYGLDTGSIGPITEMYQFRASVGTLSPTIQGFYVASILLSASLSSLASGHISDRISRKFGILSGAILTLVGCTISAASPDLASLICARLITGLGAGQSISVVTVYLCEIAPQDIRGALACVIQLMITIGIAAGYFVAYGSRNIAGSLAWRTPFVVEACIACILSVGMVLVPFSPRWLIQIGREDDARTVLTKLRDADCIDDEMKDIKMSLNFVDQGRQAGFNEMFSRQFRRRTFLGIFLMAFQQLTGIDAVLYFAPILFTQAGFSSERASFLASGISGIINVVFTIPAQIWVDKWGRRQPLIIGGLSMVVCFFVIGSLYAVHGTRMDGQVYLEGRGTQYAVVALIYVFIASYSWSWAVVGKIYACEIIPTCLRAKVCAVEQLANWIVNFAVALTAPLFLRASPSGLYFFFGSTTLFTVVVCCCFMPETKGRSLEEIEGLFEKSGRLPQEQRDIGR